MKTIALWMVLYHAGQVGAVWGPLPYDMFECDDRRDQMNAEAQRIAASGKAFSGDDLLPGDREKIADFRFVCEIRPDRPKLGEGRP